jgi:hypothetical protein
MNHQHPMDAPQQPHPDEGVHPLPKLKPDMNIQTIGGALQTSTKGKAMEWLQAPLQVIT